MLFDCKQRLLLDFVFTSGRTFIDITVTRSMAFVLDAHTARKFFVDLCSLTAQFDNLFQLKSDEC